MAGGYIAAELGLVIPFEKHDLAAGYGDIAPGREAADSVMDKGSRHHVADVDKRIVGRSPGRESHRSARAPSGCPPPPTERAGQKGSVFHHPQIPSLLADEDSAIGGGGKWRLRR